MTPWVVREAEPGASSGTGLRRATRAESAPAPEPLQPPSDDDYDWTGERGTPLGPEPPPGPCAAGLDLVPLLADHVCLRVGPLGGALHDARRTPPRSAGRRPPCTRVTSRSSKFARAAPPVSMSAIFRAGRTCRGRSCTSTPRSTARSCPRTWSLLTWDREWSATWTRSRRPAPAFEPGQTIALRALGMQIAPRSASKRWSVRARPGDRHDRQRIGQHRAGRVRRRPLLRAPRK